MHEQAQITYNLSEAGRRESLRKGGDGKFRQTEIGFITNPDDLELFRVAADGALSCDATMSPGELPPDPKRQQENVSKSAARGGIRLEVVWNVVPTWDDLLTYARWAYQEQKEVDSIMADLWKAEQAIVSRFLTNPGLRADRIEEAFVTILGSTFGSKSHPEVFKEAKARAAKDQEQVEIANRATWSRWIKQHGTENQKQRLDAGLLPEFEAKGAVEEFLFSGLKEFPLYQRFKKDEVCQCDPDIPRSCDVKFKSIDAKELSAGEWDQFAKIKAAAADANFQLREHYAQCESSLAQRKRGVIVKFSMGQLTFKREFALSNEPEKYLFESIEEV